jgi:hypothetical protein
LYSEGLPPLLCKNDARGWPGVSSSVLVEPSFDGDDRQIQAMSPAEPRLLALRCGSILPPLAGERNALLFRGVVCMRRKKLYSGLSDRWGVFTTFRGFGPLASRHFCSPACCLRNEHAIVPVD